MLRYNQSEANQSRVDKNVSVASIYPLAVVGFVFIVDMLIIRIRF